ncbi:cardiolipin synthase [Salirhabdus euzebyi]|uniref:Cardiolipin synthase n=1 Tax=Salirhabdus euzebyi TaxID=394506 RepID=A0A841Q6I2_9BACI|nr:cardiolipin synthase [Salirhabdus euzebyi]MBB6453912.1 cardiolipin synthase [Salirhabdus euzebyi]
MVWLYVGTGVVVIFFLLFLDFYFGKIHHHKNADNLSFPIASGDYSCFFNGSPLFKDMFQEIKDAKKEVCVQSYIIRNDSIGKELFTLLKQKAQEGLTVRLLVDRIGSFGLPVSVRRDLKKAGVYFTYSSKPSFPFFFYKFNRRNHRKITIIDGKIAYVGGLNVGNEYIGKSPRFNNWRDCHLRLTGELAKDVQHLFQHDWELAAKEKIEVYKANMPKMEKQGKVVATDGIGLEDMFFHFIHQAKKEIIIGTPYFIPSKSIVRALEDAINRGVVVKILGPMKADHMLVKEAAIPYFVSLKEKGADVRLFDQGFYHAKIFMIDDNFCDIGTANFDRRSLYLNKEVNVITYDVAFIQKVRELFLKDFYHSVEMNDQWLNQLNAWTSIKIVIAKLVRPLL